MNTLIAIDIGNTKTQIGLFDGATLSKTYKTPTRKDLAANQILDQWKSAAPDIDFNSHSITIASVVPPVTTELQKNASVNLTWITGNSPINFQIQRTQAETLGADLVAGNHAAIEKHGAPLIVVGIGTATTFSVFSKDKQLLGGAIAPGIGICKTALFDYAAGLEPFDLFFPSTVIQTETQGAISSGLCHGHAQMIQGWITCAVEEAKLKDPTIVLTGGASELLHPALPANYVSEPLLVLEGIMMIARS